MRGDHPPFHGSHLLLSHSSQPEFVNVCFWFVPPSLRGKQETPDYSERLAKVGCLFLALVSPVEGMVMHLMCFCPLLAVSGTAGPFSSLAPDFGDINWERAMTPAYPHFGGVGDGE